MASLQLLRDTKVEDKLPVQISYKLKSYLHEILYGSDEFLPLDKDQWIIGFYRKIHRLNLSKSLDHYLEIQMDFIRNQFNEIEDRLTVMLYLQEAIKLYKGESSYER